MLWFFLTHLRLRNIDDAPTHAADKHHAAPGFALNHVLRNLDRTQISPIDINTPQFLHAFVRVVLGFEVLGKPRGRHEHVDVAMGAEDGGYCVPDGGGIGDIRGVCGYSGDAVGGGGGGVKDAVGCREGGLTVRDLG